MLEVSNLVLWGVECCVGGCLMLCFRVECCVGGVDQLFP